MRNSHTRLWDVIDADVLTEQLRLDDRMCTIAACDLIRQYIGTYNSNKIYSKLLKKVITSSSAIADRPRCRVGQF